MTAPVAGRPPDPATRAPAIEVPAGACDAHFHLFEGPLVDRPPYQPPAVGLADYRAMLAALGVTRAVVVHTALPRDYEATIRALAGARGQWRAIALPEAAFDERLLARLHAAGFRGVRFNPYYDAERELARLEEVVARIRPLGWHAQFQLDARRLPEFAPRFERLGVEIVIDHMGRMPAGTPLEHPGFQLLLRWLRERRCWVKLSAPMRFGDPHPPYPSVVPMAQALIAAGADRVVWGSDWPHVRFDGVMPNDADLVDVLALWAPDAAQRRRILVDNPAALYGF